MSDHSSDNFRQAGKLRVFTGKLWDDPVELVKQIYAEREHRFLFEPEKEGDAPGRPKGETRD